jgi:hypothetical protein
MVFIRRCGRTGTVVFAPLVGKQIFGDHHIGVIRIEARSIHTIATKPKGVTCPNKEAIITTH